MSVVLDDQVMLEAVSRLGSTLWFAGDLRANEHIVLTAVRQDGHALRFAAEHLKNHRSIVCAAVQQNGTSLWFASDSMKRNREVVIAAVQQNWRALKFAPPDLLRDQGVVLAGGAWQMSFLPCFTCWEMRM